MSPDGIKKKKKKPTQETQTTVKRNYEMRTVFHSQSTPTPTNLKPQVSQEIYIHFDSN